MGLLRNKTQKHINRTNSTIKIFTIILSLAILGAALTVILHFIFNLIFNQTKANVFEILLQGFIVFIVVYFSGKYLQKKLI